MIKRIFFILAIFLILISCKKEHSGQHQNTKFNEEELIEELTKTVHEIWQDANDRNIERLKSAHYDNAEFSKFGPRISKRQNVTETNISETEHFSSIKNVTLVIEDLKVDIFNDVGIATFYNNFSFTKNDQSVSGKGRVTLAFLKTKNGWKIIHEHSSPFKE